MPSPIRHSIDAAPSSAPRSVASRPYFRPWRLFAASRSRLPSVGASRRVSPRAPARSPRERVVVARPDRSRVALRYREDSYDLGSYDPEMDGYVPPEVSLANFSRGDLIGSGSFGDVFRCVVDGDRRCVAKQYKRDVRGRDWFSHADERATCRRLAEDGARRGRALRRRLRLGPVPRRRRRRDPRRGVEGTTGGRRDAGRGGGGHGARRRIARTTRPPAPRHRARLRRARDPRLERGAPRREARNASSRAPARSPGGGSSRDPRRRRFRRRPNGDPDEAIFDPTYGAPEQFRRERRAAAYLGGSAVSSGVWGRATTTRGFPT